MSNHVASVASVSPAVEVAAAVPAPPPAVPATDARNDNADISRMRLTIEATPEGRFIYKVLDRVTGEVIRQLPQIGRAHV